jgi:hypothetical protein
MSSRLTITAVVEPSNSGLSTTDNHSFVTFSFNTAWIRIFHTFLGSAENFRQLIVTHLRYFASIIYSLMSVIYSLMSVIYSLMSVIYSQITTFFRLFRAFCLFFTLTRQEMSANKTGNEC